MAAKKPSSWWDSLADDETSITLTKLRGEPCLGLEGARPSGPHAVSFVSIGEGNDRKWIWFSTEGETRRTVSLPATARAAAKRDPSTRRASLLERLQEIETALAINAKSSANRGRDVDLRLARALRDARLAAIVRLKAQSCPSSDGERAKAIIETAHLLRLFKSVPTPDSMRAWLLTDDHVSEAFQVAASVIGHAASWGFKSRPALALPFVLDRAKLDAIAERMAAAEKRPAKHKGSPPPASTLAGLKRTVAGVREAMRQFGYRDKPPKKPGQWVDSTFDLSKREYDEAYNEERRQKRKAAKT